MSLAPRRLGKLAPKLDHRTLKLADYTAKIAPAPLTFDQSKHVTAPGMMLNDQLGDCTIAGAGHLLEIWTSQASKQFTAIDAQVLAGYEAVGGYVPGDSSTDNGCVMLDVLNYWRTTGLFGHKIGAYAAINPKNRQEVMDAIYYFGGIYLGFALPVSAQNQTEWSVVSGPDAEAGSWGGHCVTGAKYNFAPGLLHVLKGDKDTVTIYTWGALLTMTWEFFATYCDEAYAVLSADWVCDKTGKCPEGFDLAALQADLKAIVSA